MKQNMRRNSMYHCSICKKQILNNKSQIAFIYKDSFNQPHLQGYAKLIWRHLKMPVFICTLHIFMYVLVN